MEAVVRRDGVGSHSTDIPSRSAAGRGWSERYDQSEGGPAKCAVLGQSTSLRGEADDRGVTHLPVTCLRSWILEKQLALSYKLALGQPPDTTAGRPARRQAGAPSHLQTVSLRSDAVDAARSPLCQKCQTVSVSMRLLPAAHAARGRGQLRWPHCSSGDDVRRTRRASRTPLPLHLDGPTMAVHLEHSSVNMRPRGRQGGQMYLLVLDRMCRHPPRSHPPPEAMTRPLVFSIAITLAAC